MKKRILIAILAVLSTLFLAAGLAACAPQGGSKYSVTVTCDETMGTLTLNPARENNRYDSGTVVTATVTPKAGYAVDDFLADGISTPLTDNTYTFTVTKNIALSVTFVPSESSEYTVTVDCDAAKGAVVLSPAREGNVYPAGTDVTFTVEPVAGYIVSAFQVNGETKTLDGNNSHKEKVTANLNISVTFETAPNMEAALLASVTAPFSVIGTGEEDRIYEGYEDFPIIYQYAFRTAFDGHENVLRLKRDTGMNILYYNSLFSQENGSVVEYERTLDNRVETTTLTGESFDNYRNPFGTLVQASDFSLVRTGVYVIRDAGKAQIAARALTGQTDNVARFEAYASADEGVYAFHIETEECPAHGIELDYVYVANYDFTVDAAEDLSGRKTPYEYANEHTALERALQSAAEANSYTYHVVEQDNFGTYEYNVYVTENAVYNDENSAELGFILHDGLVHEFTVNGTRGEIGAPASVEGYNADGNYGNHQTGDISELQAHFDSVSAALFEPKGEGKFAVRAQDVDLVPAIAQLFYDGNDTVTMSFAEELVLTVENETLKSLTVTTRLYNSVTTYTFTYRDWDETVLPVTFESDPVPTPSGYPEKFHGTYEGETADGSAYVVIISAGGIVITVDGTPKPVNYVSYDARYEEISITVDGEACTIANYSSGDTVDEIGLSGGYGSSIPTLTLTRQGSSGSDTPVGPTLTEESFYGTYESADGATVITISESGIEVTMAGVKQVATDVAYANKEFTFKLGSEKCSIINNTDDSPVSQISFFKGNSLTYLDRQE